MPFILIATVVLAWFFLGSEVGANWLSGLIAPERSTALPTAKVAELNGRIKIISHGRVTAFESKDKPALPLELRDGDRLEVDAGSRAVVILNSQDEFEIKDLASIIFQLWNPNDQGSPVYVNSLQGQLNLLRAGIRNRAYVMKDGRLYLPGQKPSQKPLALTVLRSAPLDMELAASEGAEEAVSETPEEAGVDTPQGTLPETLSNEYIDEVVAGKQGQLQKCWLTRLKDTPSGRGQITLQFEITRRGQVKDVRVTDSTLNDGTLQKCITSVFERLQFRRFKGTEISLTYPLTFE